MFGVLHVKVADVIIHQIRYILLRSNYVLRHSSTQVQILFAESLVFADFQRALGPASIRIGSC